MNIVIDMGGTNTRIGFSKDLKEFDRVEKFPTPQSKEEANKKFAEILGSTIEGAGEKIDAVMFGIAGTVDYSEDIVINATNIKWIDHMSASDITGIKNIPIHAYNDTEFAGIAEAEEYTKTRVAYITISTGVGGTLIVNGKVDSFVYNFEPGHIIIDKSSVDSPTDNIRGSFESLCSGTGFKLKNNIDPANCTDQKLWNQYGSDLADGLYTLTLLWQPSVIILGGSMTNQWDLFYNPLIQRFTSYPAYYVQPSIVKAKLGDSNGLIGGLKLLN